MYIAVPQINFPDNPVIGKILRSTSKSGNMENQLTQYSRSFYPRKADIDYMEALPVHEIYQTSEVMIYDSEKNAFIKNIVLNCTACFDPEIEGCTRRCLLFGYGFISFHSFNFCSLSHFWG